MSSEIVCNLTSTETRVALLENSLITELFVERDSGMGYVGNVYKGKVTKILPGMQVAFVDIGLAKAGFLYVADVDNISNGLGDRIKDEDRNGKREDLDLEIVPERHEHGRIEELLKEGLPIMVQISKDPLGTKGARITGYVTLPGRHLVYMPTIDQVGVSRRIASEDEKKRLREAVRELKAEGSGYIVRTAAEGKGIEELTADVNYLEAMWQKIIDKYETAAVPSLVYQELNLIRRTIRDLYSDDVRRIVIDDFGEYESTLDFCRSFLPSAVEKIEYYDGKEPLFDAFGIEIEIERALERKVWLKSGGYIVIDQTEALASIDVNTGKFVGSKNQEETVVKTNMEAVKEIVYQLRLRNIGGLIIIDFIDMEREENKEKVYSALDEALKYDRSRATILKISEFGLVEMTRKRVRESLARTLTDVCPVCDGRGAVKSATTIIGEVYREIARVAGRNPGRDISCLVTPRVADLLLVEEPEHLMKLETETGAKISIDSSDTLAMESFKVAPKIE